VKRTSGGELARDAAIAAGGGLLIFGAWSAWHPLGYIFAGLLLVSFALLAEIDSARKVRQNQAERIRHGSREIL
jgi:hypothetical protein